MILQNFIILCRNHIFSQKHDFAWIFGFWGSKSVFPPCNNNHLKRFELSSPSLFQWKVNEADYSWDRHLEIIDREKIVISDSYNAIEAEGFLYFSHYLKEELIEGKSIYLSCNNQSKYQISIDGADVFEMQDVDYFPAYGLRSSTTRLRWYKSFPPSRRGKINVSITKVK